MNKRKECLLIEDEYYALELLENFVNKTEDLSLAGKFRNPLPAYELLTKGNIDILFLDVDLPQISGLTFLNQLPFKPVTIITTAHTKYASQAFELDVADYLVKPYSYERFKKALQKAERWSKEEKKTTESLQVKSNGYWINIPHNEILYIEGWKEYVKIHCKDRMILSLLSLTSLESELSANKFIRIHKSYIINMNEVQSFNSESIVMYTQVILPISRSKKEIVVSMLKKIQ